MKVGVIGLGAMGKNHSRVLSNMQSVTELKLYDPLGRDLDKVLGLEVDSDLEMFLDNKFDYCVVSSPTSTHLEVALKLAERGLPTLIEKPLASNFAEAKEISKAFRSSGTLGAVGHIERFNPSIIELRKNLKTDLIGKLIQITTRRVGPYSGRIRDVGVVKDLASHDIDLVSWLTGSQYRNVFARTASPMMSPHEDSLLALGDLENGTLFSHVVNWVSPKKERVTSVLGEGGLLVADTLSGDLFFFENGTSLTTWDGVANLRGVSEGAVHKFEILKEEPLVQEHRSFQHALFSGDWSEVVSLEQGLEVLRVAELMLKQN